MVNLRLNEKINIQRNTKKYLYNLGNIATKNYDTTVTKHMTGNLKDELGIRVVSGDSLTIKKTETGTSSSNINLTAAILNCLS
mgnify:CR=1 FL=1